MAFAWRSSVGAGASLGLIALAGVLTLVGGLLSMALIPLTLLVLLDYPSLASWSDAAQALALLWFPTALTASLYLAVTALEQMKDPDWREIIKLMLLTAGIFLTFALGIWFEPLK